MPSPATPVYRHELRRPLVRTVVEQRLDLAQLRSRPTNGASRPCDLSVPRTPETTAVRLPQRRQPLLALELERARLLVHDRLLGRPPRRLADVDAARLRDRLDARGGVDEIAGDHALGPRADRHRRFACEHARARPQFLRADLLAQRRHGRDEIERRADGPLRVVLGRHGRAPHGHDRVADELLHRAAVELDQPPAEVEVAREQLANLLGIARLREAREADQVGEQHGDEPALGRGSLSCGRDLGAGPMLGRDRRAALVAELLVPGESSAAGAAVRRRGERRPALLAELLPFEILGPAARADHLAEPTPGCAAQGAARGM